MTMKPFNGDITQSLKWLQNKAPYVSNMIKAKSNWYLTYNTQFWANWYTSVFDLRQANPFGIMVWCIILGVPSGGFGLYPGSASWAFGNNRQNFIYSGTDPNFEDPSTGGNFYGGGNMEILSLDEIRKLLRLRYVALVNNGSMAYVNRMLRYIFNDDAPWDYSAGRYFYVADSTIVPGNLGTTGYVVNPIVGAFKIEYRVGHAMGLSSQLINLLNDTIVGITPKFAGCKITVIQE